MLLTGPQCGQQHFRSTRVSPSISVHTGCRSWFTSITEAPASWHLEMKLLWPLCHVMCSKPRRSVSSAGPHPVPFLHMVHVARAYLGWGWAPAGELAGRLHKGFRAWSFVEHFRSACQHLGGPLVVPILEHQLSHVRVLKDDYSWRTRPALAALFAHIGIVSKDTASSRGAHPWGAPIQCCAGCTAAWLPVLSGTGFTQAKCCRQKAMPGPGCSATSPTGGHHVGLLGSNGIFDHKKDGNNDTYYNMDESQKYVK